MPLSISASYTNNSNLELGHMVDVNEQKVEAEHQGTTVTVTETPAQGDFNVNDAEMEEFDLSLDEVTGDKKIEAFKQDQDSEFTATNGADPTNASASVGGETAEFQAEGGTDSSNLSPDASLGTGASGRSGSMALGQESGEGFDGNVDGTSPNTNLAGNNGAKGGNLETTDSGTGTPFSNANMGGDSPSLEVGDVPSVAGQDTTSGEIVSPEVQTVTITIQNDDGTVEEQTMTVAEYRELLLRKGFIEEDIQRVIDGVIQFVDLYNEILVDQDSSRRARLLAASYLKYFELDFNDLDSFLTQIENDEALLQELISQRQNTELGSHEAECFTLLLFKMQT